MSELVIPKMNPLSTGGAHIFLNIISQFQIIGRENIPPPPFLYTSNHIAFGDAMVSAAVVKGSVPVLTARKYQGTLVGFLMTVFLAPVWIEQSSSDRAAIKQALGILAAGSALGIAPEGTRNRTGEMKEGQEGVAFLARKANVPILPVGLFGTEKLFKQFRPKVGAVVGKPYYLPPVEGPAKNSLALDRDRIMCAIAALLPPPYRGVYADHPLVEEMKTLVQP